MSRTTIERDGVRVAVAVQVHVGRGGCGCETPGSRPDAGGAGLADLALVLAGGLVHSIVSLANLARLAGVGLAMLVGVVLLAAARTTFLGLNVAGWLLAVVCRGTLLMLAHAGITHRRLSRRLSPWLAEDTDVPEEDTGALVAQALERPQSARPQPPALPAHTRTTWAQLAAAPDQQPATARRLKP